MELFNKVEKMFMKINCLTALKMINFIRFLNSANKRIKSKIGPIL